ncbi:hypothetical protein G6N86_26505 [Klebsiella pneumoniae subsp. pneumoniae]|nr:hypothetical protein [Klebsiella pneumoniae subsp. pneumoniae]
MHAFPRPVIPVRPLSRRGLSSPMHLHENRPTKRAGEEGKALRARTTKCVFILAVKYNAIQY